MTNCAQVTSAVKEQVIVSAGKKGFFRRIAERIGLAQREVAECRGKSLSEMAEMTSKKDVVEIAEKESIPAIKPKTREDLFRELDAMPKRDSSPIATQVRTRQNIFDEIDTVSKEIERREKSLSETNAVISMWRKEISYLKAEAECLDLSKGHYDTDICRWRPNKRLAENQARYEKLMESIKFKEGFLSDQLALNAKSEATIKQLTQQKEALFAEAGIKFN